MITTLTKRIEVYDLPRCMDASICAPGAGKFNELIGDDRQRILNEGLHAETCPLALPAVVRRAIVLNAQSDPHIELSAVGGR